MNMLSLGRHSARTLKSSSVTVLFPTLQAHYIGLKLLTLGSAKRYTELNRGYENFSVSKNPRLNKTLLTVSKTAQVLQLAERSDLFYYRLAPT